MPGAPVIRVVSFAPTAGLPVDERLRAVWEPMATAPGLEALVLGRRQASGPERVIVSVWASDEALCGALGTGAAGDLSEHDRRCDGADHTVAVAPISFSLVQDEIAPAAVLRIFNGVLQPGELEAYVEDARTGTLADIAAEYGPRALYLGASPPDRFVTVSLWDGWDRIGVATGGDIRNPIATRHAQRLASWTAVHYELVSAYRGSLEKGR